MISNFKEYYKVSDYLAQFTNEKIGLAIGAANLLDIFDEKYYTHLSGGIFEALGKLFNRKLEIYVYPFKKSSDELLNSKNLKTIDNKFQVLYDFFRNENQIIDIENFEENNLKIFSHEVLEKIRNNEENWEQYLPKTVATLIKEKKLFQ